MKDQFLKIAGKEQVDLTFIEVGTEEEEAEKRRASRRAEASAAVNKVGAPRKKFDDDMGRNKGPRPAARRPKLLVLRKLKSNRFGEMSEWSKEHDWKSCMS